MIQTSYGRFKPKNLEIGELGSKNGGDIGKMDCDTRRVFVDRLEPFVVEK